MADIGQMLAQEGLAFPAADGLTAHAGGGQASATQVPGQSSGVYRFTTVATAADSCILPTAPSVGSSDVTLINAGVASMNVFPPVGSQINNAGANVAFALAAGKTASFFSINGVWHAQLSA